MLFGACVYYIMPRMNTIKNRFSNTIIIFILKAQIKIEADDSLVFFFNYFSKKIRLGLSVCHFVLVFFSPISIAISSPWEERANLSAFRTFVRFVLV